MSKIKLSLISFLVATSLMGLSYFISKFVNTNDCNASWVHSSYERVRDWRSENPLVAGFIDGTVYLVGLSSKFPNGGVVADHRDAFAVGKDAYCLNNNYGKPIYKTGIILGLFVFFSLLLFCFRGLRLILSVSDKERP